MSEVKRGVAVALVEGDVEWGGREGLPKLVNAMRGKSKYPFDKLAVGHTMRIKREVDTIRSAIRGWVKRHGGRFVARADQPGWTKVWRLK